MGRVKDRGEPRSLIASAVSANFKEPLWNKYFSSDETWQSEIWRLYDVVPEFSRGANWVGSACSRVRIYVAEVDEAGEVQQEVPKKSPYAKYSYHLFGGPARQQDLLRLMGVDLTVSGEFWILGIDGDADTEDKWYAVSRNELQRVQMTIATDTEPLIGEPPEVYEFFDGKMRHQLIEGEDIMYRCWTPHPYRTWNADSPGRSLQMVLVELEILTQYILAQARSRLASAGVWIWPSGTDFPSADDNPVTADSLMDRMLKAGEQNMKSFGSASQVLPMIVEMPEKVFDRIKAPIVFGSELSKEAMELRRELRERLAAGMDIAPEIVTGMGEATGWNTFSITADTVETVVKPIMARICNAATQVYLWPALKAAGKPWKRYKFWFDTAALTIRPQRLKETMELRQMGIVSDAEVLKAADLPPSAAITKEERERDLATALLKSDGNLLVIADLRTKAGLDISIVPDGVMPGQEQAGAPGLGGRAPAPPPPERTLKEATGPSTSPRNSTRPGSPTGDTPEPVAASAVPANEMALVVAANAAVLQALEKAGKALLRDPRGAQFRAVPHNEVYLHLGPKNRDHAQALLASGWTHLDAMLADLGRQDETESLRATLMEYCLHLMAGTDRPLVHEVRVMRGWLREFL
jgi:hypothetical protein